MPAGQFRKHAKRRSQRRPTKFSRRAPKTRNPRSKSYKKSRYAPKNKARFIARSNPIAENKQLEGTQFSESVGNNSAGGRIFSDYSVAPANQSGHIANSMHWNFNPDSMMYQVHGLNDHEMIGRSTYQRLCAAKFLIKWPQPSMNIGVNKYGSNPPVDLGGVVPDQAMSYKLYWGWVPHKLLHTGLTNPTAPLTSAQHIEEMINQRVKDYFNARRDRIAFIPKSTATLKIIGSKRVFPPWKTHSGRIPVSMNSETSQIATIDGDPVTYHPNTFRYSKESIPDTLVKIKWPINRKVHFEPTNNIGQIVDAQGNITATNIQTTPTVFYRNYDWQPFCVLVSWNHDKLPADDPTNANHDLRYERRRRSPQILVNDITYYRDS